MKRLVANSEFAKNSCTVCPAGSGRNSTTEKCEVCADEYVNSQTTYRAECAPLTCDPGYGYTTDWDASLDSTNSGNCVECEGATTSPSGNGQCAAIQCDRGYKPIAEGDIDHTVSNTDPKNCEDIKECDSNPCHSKATCHEVEGSTDQYSEGYYCTCNEPWYEGDGKEQCEHKNLCETDTCDTDYERCVNGEESNPTCKDKNECETWTALVPPTPRARITTTLQRGTRTLALATMDTRATERRETLSDAL